MFATFACAAPISDAFVRHTVQVTDHVWLIYRTFSSTEPPFEGNVEVFEQSNGLVVVDAGGCPLSGKHVVTEIKKISAKPVKLLVYTHYHGDHNLGAGAFRVAWPQMEILSTAQTRASMTGAPMDYIKTYSGGNKGMVDFAHDQLKDDKLSPSMRAGWQHLADAGPSIVAAYKDLKAYPADITFTDEIAIPDADTPLEVRFLGRANTDGDAIVWAPNQKVVAAGDIVVNPVPYASASYPKDWIEVLKALKAYNFAFLVPGHGAIETGTGYLDELIAALEDVRAQVRPLVAKGVSLDEVRKQIDLARIEQAFAGTDDWQRFALANFFLGAIVSNAYKEAKGEPIVQGKDGG